MFAEHEEAIQLLRHKVRDTKRVATCLGFGPRFLHSTGQDYKGGPNSGVFLQITAKHSVDVEIPGQKLHLAWSSTPRPPAISRFWSRAAAAPCAFTWETICPPAWKCSPPPLKRRWSKCRGQGSGVRDQGSGIRKSRIGIGNNPSPALPARRL